MKLALFDEHRLGVVTADGLVDVTGAVPDHSADAETAGWWRRLCRELPSRRAALLAAAAAGPPQPLDSVRLRAPALNPSKIVACASNYAAHVEEMREVQQRTLGGVEPWMLSFEVFLKAPSSISGPAEDVVLPAAEVAAGHEIHHESELVLVIGRGGRDIAVAEALDHVAGYTIGLDITVRSAGDRSRRKSYDTFSPLGPWLTTADEVGEPADLEIDLWCGAEHRQHVRTGSMLTPVREIVAHASRMMTLLPGDVVFTGAPPGVGPIGAGDVLHTRIRGLGEMTVGVR